READLLAVLSLLQSRHKLQRRSGHLVAELSSFFLVATLVRYGRPPGRDLSASLPPLPKDHLAAFCRGFHRGQGKCDESGINWVGSERLLTELQRQIRDVAGVGPGRVHPAGRRRKLTWSAPADVARLEAWLGLLPADQPGPQRPTAGDPEVAHDRADA